MLVPFAVREQGGVGETLDALDRVGGGGMGRGGNGRLGKNSSGGQRRKTKPGKWANDHGDQYSTTCDRRQGKIHHRFK